MRCNRVEKIKKRMSMLKRKAEKVLLEWLEGKDALLITGGRQV